jgi:hypothetical protein
MYTSISQLPTSGHHYLLNFLYFFYFLYLLPFIRTSFYLIVAIIPATMAPPIRLIQERYKKRKRKVLLYTFLLGATAASIYWHNNFNKNIQHDSKLTGKQWMDELLEGHEARIRDNLGVSREGFLHLEKVLKEESTLQATKYMGTKEQLGLFLYAVTTDLSMRKLVERFQRSTETIQRTYHKVMRSFLYKDFYDSNIQTNPASPLSEYNELNRSFFPYFKDCVGAIDGTHIPISPPENIKSNYRNRKGELSQNVLAVCNFDMRFTDILCGWEGSVSDSHYG